MAARSFSTTKARTGGSATVFPVNPEFKDLAQTWGWKMIRVHEKMYP
jgi:hypothetical protein